MNICIISREGSPSTREIGSFLLKNKEKYMKVANFNIVRVSAQNEIRTIKEYGVTNLPFIIANNKKIVGVSQIKSFLIDLIKPKIPELSHEEYLLRTNAIKRVDNKIMFVEDIEDEYNPDKAKKELSNKILEFEKRKKNTKINYPKNETELESEEQDYKLEDHEIDMENWLSEITKTR